MEALIVQATTFVTLHGAWAGPLVGILSFGESLAIVGLFIPATAFMLAIGGLVAVGVLDPVTITSWAVVGAILGDWISYWAGRRLGSSIYYRWPLNRHRPIVARTRLFFRKYGMAAVFLGRFLGPIRATVPLVAGVLAMRKRPFQIANIASALLWVPLMFLPGFLVTAGGSPSIRLSETHMMAGAAGIVCFSLIAMFVTSRILGGDRQRRRRKARMGATPLPQVRPGTGA